VVYGVGERHVKLMLAKMKAKFGVEVETSPPKIASRETIQAKSEGHHRHRKQSGGAGQFGEVYLRIEPLPDESPESRINGLFGYLGDDAEIDRGGYETDSFWKLLLLTDSLRLAPAKGSADRIIDTSTRLLWQLKDL